MIQERFESTLTGKSYRTMESAEEAEASFIEARQHDIDTKAAVKRRKLMMAVAHRNSDAIRRIRNASHVIKLPKIPNPWN